MDQIDRLRSRARRETTSTARITVEDRQRTSSNVTQSGPLRFFDQTLFTVPGLGFPVTGKVALGGLGVLALLFVSGVLGGRRRRSASGFRLIPAR